MRYGLAYTAALLVAVLTARVTGRAAEPGSIDQPAPPSYSAVLLDQDGQLSAALPLYRARAAETQAVADRLRYAAALLRAGRVDEGRALLDAVSSSGAGNARVCASSLLENGFPGLARRYLEPVAQDAPHDVALVLLLIRARAAAGDRIAARLLVDALVPASDTWVSGQRIELARWQLRTGASAAGRGLLDRELKDSLGQLFRDSARADAVLRDAQWAQADAMLAAAERKVPAALSGGKVAREWHNAQRELHWIELRRAISLWKEGKREPAAAEALKARAGDEEYVRSAATLLLVASDLAQGQPRDASEKLRTLAGHDQRFASAAVAIAAAPTPGGAAAAWHRLHTVLAAEDRSAELVTGPLFEILHDATQTVTATRVSAR